MSVNDVWIRLIAFYLLCGGKEGRGREGGGGGRGGGGFGDVLPIFITSRLFGCALDFLVLFCFVFVFWMENSCDM